VGKICHSKEIWGLFGRDISTYYDGEIKNRQKLTVSMVRIMVHQLYKGVKDRGSGWREGGNARVEKGTRVEKLHRRGGIPKEKGGR